MCVGCRFPASRPPAGGPDAIARDRLGWAMGPPAGLPLDPKPKGHGDTVEIDGTLIICDDNAQGKLPGTETQCVYCPRVVHMPDAALALTGRTAVIPICPPCAVARHPDEMVKVRALCPTGIHEPRTAHLPVPALAEYLGSLRAPDIAEYLARMRKERRRRRR